jgi:hypothetical protein
VAEQLFARCRFLSQEVRKITLVFDKGNNSEDNLKLVDQTRLHFIGSLVPTQHSDLLAIPRAAMHRRDRSQLAAVWAYRTHKVVFGVKRTVLVTFNQRLFRAQTKTLSRGIHKRQRKLEKLVRLRQSALASAILDGVVVGSLALMAVVTWQLGRAAIVDWRTVLILIASVVLVLRFRVNSTWGDRWCS